jgi:hypothetical protein
MRGKADGPASGRMQFGYLAHRDAGVPFIAPRSAARLAEDLEEMKARRAIKALCEQWPQCRSWAADNAKRLGAIKLLTRLKKKIRQGRG